MLNNLCALPDHAPASTMADLQFYSNSNGRKAAVGAPGNRHLYPDHFRTEFRTGETRNRNLLWY